MNVGIVDGHEVVTVRSTLLVVEAGGVEEFVDGRSNLTKSGSVAAEARRVQRKILPSTDHTDVAVATANMFSVVLEQNKSA